jgi:fibronectin type 3 domain-containing protein
VEFWAANTGTPPPAPPTSLTATGSSQEIRLSWSASSGATSYLIKRSTTSGGPYVTIASVSSTNYTDSALPTNRLYYSSTYYYVVSAVNANGEGANSAQAKATMPPGAPPRLTAVRDLGQVRLWWDFPGGAETYIVKRATMSGGPYLPIATNLVNNNYTDPQVVAGTNYYYVVTAVNAGGEGPPSAEVTINPPFPWMSREVGSGGGGVYFSNGVFNVSGSGADIWGTADAFRFVYVPVTGNCALVARVVSVENVDPWSKAGVMIRASLEANAANAFLAVTPSNGVTWQYRTSTGGNSANNNTTGLSAPHWVRLVRNGNSFTGYRSTNGVNWVQQGNSVTIAMASNVYAGLAVTAHNNSSMCLAVFDNVTVPGWTNWVLPPPPPALTGAAGNARVSLVWAAASNTTGYQVKRSTNSSGPYVLIAQVAGTSFTDTGLANGTTYFYIVTSVNPAGESAPTAPVALTPQAPPLLNISWSGAGLTLAWPQAHTGFAVQARTNLIGGDWQEVPSPAPYLSNGQWRLNLPPPSEAGSVFYRLAK